MKEDSIPENEPTQIGRTSFLKGAAILGTTAFFSKCKDKGDMFDYLKPLDHANPLTGYPNRGWEKHYRNLFEYDSTFHFLCAPNDTHNCLLTAYVKNGVTVRIGPSFGFGKATDIYGNKASHRWDPRCCQKGLALARRFYGDRRCKEPMVRKGFLDWSKSNFERDPNTKAVPAKYLNRGRDSWVKVTWEEAFDLEAKAIDNIARAYTGEEGKKALLAQGYDPAMVDAMEGAGIRSVKMRGGMPALGITRIQAQYRLANMLALLDSKIRTVGPDKAKGATGWDNYTWHTDLPPGHPMVTGQQTNDFDLVNTEYSNFIISWGMNWITTKMPDSHWLTEARMKGAKVAVIAVEYSATCSKADYALVVRPGTTPALALGFCYHIIKEKKFNPDYVRKYTDFPFLVRMDNLEMLKATDLDKNHKNASLQNYLQILKKDENPPVPNLQKTPLVSESMREEWGDFLVWDEKSKKTVVVSRDNYGKEFDKLGVTASLEGAYKVKLADGKEIEVRPVFELLKNYIMENYDLASTSKITWAPVEGIKAIADEIANNKGKTLFAMGMGPNQFFNSDLKDRTVFLLAALTENVGKIGGNVGSYAGNYRWGFMSGLGNYTMEDPFNINTSGANPSKIKRYFRPESVHYWNHGDKILRMGKEILTGKSHIPCPTKAIHVSNSNSLIGNVKGHYDVVINTLPKTEFLAVNEWWWTASCEYADIVFPVDSWAEFKHPDMTISVTNPFLYIFPRTPMKRIYNTKSDIEVAAGVGMAFAKMTKDDRFEEYWKYVHKNKVSVYLQRILNTSNAGKGYDIDDLEDKAKKGIPALLMTRTYPKFGAYEQEKEDKPYYTKTGRLEFYRGEKEFIDSGENLPVYREPIDSTFYEPNVIVSKANSAIRPRSPESYGESSAKLDADSRQARHVVKSWGQVEGTTHPLSSQGFKFIFHTPKYRHGAHSTPVDTDIVAVWFGPFGDMHRRDKRMPFVAEAYMDINPLDAKAMGIQDGDYVYVDADPHDRPFAKWQGRKEEYEVARLLCRARYYNGTPRGVTRMWHNMYGATFGSVKGAKTRADGLAKNPDTGYQSMFRGGSHQSATRGWLKPTWMTDSLVRKDIAGQKIGKGFEPDVHCPTGAPRESFVKITKSEDGGMGGKGLWRPAAKKLRPTYESAELLKFIKGGYIR